MKSAPASYYSIGLPKFLKWLVLLFLFSSLVLVIIFVLQQKANPSLQLEKVFILIAAWVLSCYAIIDYLTHYLSGHILFTGQKWQLRSDEKGQNHTPVLEPIVVTCIWDLRSKMVLQIKIAKHKKYWVIIEYIQEPTQWLAIRRAILDSAH